MKYSLTSTQKIVLSTVRDLSHKKGTPPTMEELRIALNLKTISSVQRHTDALKEKGYLENTRGISFPETTEKVQIPLVGNVACGVPLLATENIEAYIPYDVSKLSGSSENYFFLRAIGDSMNNTDIRGKSIDDGDYVLVKKAQTAELGKRVVALIGEEATIKKYIPENGHVRLQPETNNRENKPILIFEDFSIQGIVEDIIKN